MEDRVRRWAVDVKGDLETPDLWAELRHQRELLSQPLEDVENTPFTPDEQAAILTELRKLKEAVKQTHQLSTEQMAALDAGFDRLEASATQRGRIDWRDQLLALMLVLIVTGILPPEAVHSIFVGAFQLLQHIFGGGEPPRLLH